MSRGPIEIGILPHAAHAPADRQRWELQHVEKELRERLESAYDQLASLAIGLIEAVIVFFLAWLVYRRLRGPVRRRIAVTPIPDNGKLLIENVASIVVYAFAFTLLLGLWGATWGAILTAISFSTIVVGLGLQDLLRSFAAGIFIAFERPFNVGDEIKVRDVFGKVESIGLRKTLIRAASGELITAPNSLLFTDPITNQSPYRTMRTTITVSGVSGTPAELKSAVAASLADVPGLEASPAIAVRSQRSKVKASPRFRSIDAINRGTLALVKPGVARGTQVRVEWVGSGQPAVREEVVRRLKALFPDSQVRVQRH